VARSERVLVVKSVNAQRVAVRSIAWLDLMIMKDSSDVISRVHKHVNGAIASGFAIAQFGAAFLVPGSEVRLTEQCDGVVACDARSHRAKLTRWNAMRKCINHDARYKKHTQHEHSNKALPIRLLRRHGLKIPELRFRSNETGDQPWAGSLANALTVSRAGAIGCIDWLG
jgi:hypothetical protein